MARSLNRVQLIGNLTRDPELRYTPSGTAVCTFSLATNRSWTTDTGEKHEESEFHRIVAWNKLGELCSQFLTKGRKVYVEGRLSTRNWTTQDGQQRTTTEVVIDDMILLDNKRPVTEETSASAQPASQTKEESTAHPQKSHSKTGESKKEETVRPVQPTTNDSASAGAETEAPVAPDDIPF